MRITWYSHSCFLLETGEHRILTDPYLTGNPRAGIPAADVACTHVLCSHAHEDHLGDTVQIARRTGATVVAPYELAEYISAQRVRTEDPMPGGCVRLAFGEVKVTPALHSCALEAGGGKNLPLGIACGYVITAEGRRVYFAGDTALFSDMRLIGRPTLDLALLPIGDHYTMASADAVLALEYLCPKLCVPMHYGTNARIAAAPEVFRSAAAEAGHRVFVPKVGVPFEL